MPFEYPSATWDTPNALLNYSGGFWRDVYTGQKELRAFVAGAALLRRQRAQDWNEMVDSLSRHKVKNTHREWLYPLTIHRSEIDSYDAQVLHYGDGEAFRRPTPNLFGAVYQQRVYRFPLPIRIRRALAVMSGVDQPAWTAEAGTDFSIDTVNSRIVFRENPFENPALTAFAIIDNNEIVDHAITLWVYAADIEDETAYTHFGGILGLPLSMHENAVEFMNAYADSVYCGPAHGQVCRMLTAVCDIPLVKEETEVVELITRDSGGLHIVTDKHAYNYPEDNSPVVAEGDVVRAGASMTDAIDMLDIRDGVTPDALRCLTVGADLLAPGFATGLMFDNQDVPVTVDTEHHSGRTFVSWPLGGQPAVVEDFWNQVHARGIIAGKTIAELLDVRANPVGQPTADSLPATINPLAFLVQNILRFHTFVVIIRPSLLPGTGLGFAWLRHLRRALPPHVMVLTVFELRAKTTSVKMSVTDNLLPGTYDPPPAVQNSSTVTATASSLSSVRVSCL